MTIAADNTKTIVDGNDVATVFNYTFKINFSTDLKVVKTDASDVETVLTEGVHYSVTGVGADAGGSITYPLVGDPLPTGEKITMYRVPAITQLTDIINQGGFLPEVIENALDLLTMIAQMTNEAVNRSIKLDVSDESGADLSLSSPVAGTVLGWNSTADALENISPGSVALALPASDSIVASMINAAGTQATLDKLLSSNIVKWQKGADIPSAAALALGSDGNIFDVTGTTAITSIGAVGVGTLVVLQFDGALTLTHHATDLILPGAANITTAAGDHAVFYEYAAGDWRCLVYTRAAERPLYKSLFDLGSDVNGDIYYRSGGVLTRLPKGYYGDKLSIENDLPVWARPKWTVPLQIGNDLNIATVGAPALAGLSSTRVAFIDDTNDHLRTYDFTNPSWAQVGNNLAIATVASPSLTALSSSTVAFIDGGNANLGKYSFDGTDWSLVGNALNIAGVGIPRVTALNSTDIAFIDSVNADLRVYRFDGTDWAQVGNDLNITGIGTPSIVALNSTDIAFIDGSNDDLRVYRFDGTDWAQVGNDLNITGVGIAGLAALNGTDVAFIDNGNADMRVYRFDGADWIQVGNELSIAGIGVPYITALDDSDIAFIDSTNDDLRTYRLTQG